MDLGTLMGHLPIHTYVHYICYYIHTYVRTYIHIYIIYCYSLTGCLLFDLPFFCYFFPETPHELATEHWQRMIHATKCRKPLPRVIPVSNNTSKRYEPYATILHRCGEDTGCCGSTATVCTVKRYEIVMVYVFVSIPIPYIN